MGIALLNPSYAGLCPVHCHHAAGHIEVLDAL
jgi:hypothetical protein